EDQSYTSLTRLHLFFFTDPAGVSEATQREVERLIPLFEARDDHLGVAKARRRLAMVYRTRRDVRSMEQQLEQAVEHARRAAPPGGPAPCEPRWACASMPPRAPSRPASRRSSSTPPTRRNATSAAPSPTSRRWASAPISPRQ